MNLFGYINKNIERIKFDIRIGIIGCALLKHWQIYAKFDYYRKAGNKVSMSVDYCCDDFCISENSVYKIIKKMEAEL